MEARSITIESRFRGPPRSGNGGYVCGRLAALIDGPARVRLRVPPPLDRPLVGRREGEEARLLDGDEVVATAIPGRPQLEVPRPPTLEQARRARERYAGQTGHVFPTCFVCGPARAEGDGLRIFAGPVAGREIAASPWVPHASLAGDDGTTVRREYVWAALDCPSWFGFADFSTWEGRPLLGRLTADVRTLPRVGERLVASGWTLGRDGRKIHVASALHREDGELLGLAKAVWLTVLDG